MFDHQLLSLMHSANELGADVTVTVDVTGPNGGEREMAPFEGCSLPELFATALARYAVRPKAIPLEPEPEPEPTQPEPPEKRPA